MTEEGSSIARPRVGQVYGLALLLVFGLFLVHIIFLFDIARLLLETLAPLEAWVGRHRAGQAIIMGCFVVLFIAHLCQAVLWALFLRWQGLVAGFADGLYYSAVTITTLGYGDVVLSRPWRQIGPLVAIGGILKFGCSTAFLFVVIQGVWAKHL
jgi:voltage-gated potassium channel Kch